MTTGQAIGGVIGTVLVFKAIEKAIESPAFKQTIKPKKRKKHANFTSL